MNNGGKSGWSTPVSAATGSVTIPLIPIITNVKGTGYAAVSGVKVMSKEAAMNSVKLEWTPDAKHTETNQFVIEVRMPKNGKTPARLIATVTMTIGANGSMSDYIVAGLKKSDVSINSVLIAKTSKNLGVKYTLTIKGLQSGTKYTIQAQAADGNKLSKMVSVSASTAKYAAVKNLKAPKDTIGLTSITLTWAASTTPKPSGGTETYMIDVYDGKTFIKTVPAIGTSAKIEGLSPSKKYSFQVKAVAKDVSGNVIAESAVAKISVSTAKYTAVKSLKAVTPAIGLTYITLTWTASSTPKPSGGTETYTIDVYDGKTFIKTVPVIGTSAKIEGLSPSKQYSFQVKAAAQHSFRNAVME